MAACITHIVCGHLGSTVVDRLHVGLCARHKLHVDGPKEGVDHSNQVYLALSFEQMSRHLQHHVHAQAVIRAAVVGEPNGRLDLDMEAVHIIFIEMGRYPLQIQWLQRTVRYWNKLVANTANSELLDFVLAAEVHQGLVNDHDCWAKELLAGLTFADPSRDWQTHMLQLKPVENPRGVAGLAKQKFADSIREFDSDPTDPECPHRQHNTYCQLMHHADDSGLLEAPAYISADISLQKKQAIAKVRLVAAPIRCNTEHSVAYSARTCLRCGLETVDNEHHLFFECKHSALTACRTRYSALFSTAKSVSEWMVAAYNPELATTAGSCIQDMLTGLRADPQGQPNVTPAS